MSDNPRRRSRRRGRSRGSRPDATHAAPATADSAAADRPRAQAGGKPAPAEQGRKNTSGPREESAAKSRSRRRRRRNPASNSAASAGAGGGGRNEELAAAVVAPATQKSAKTGSASAGRRRRRGKKNPANYSFTTPLKALDADKQGSNRAESSSGSSASGASSTSDVSRSRSGRSATGSRAEGSRGRGRRSNSASTAGRRSARRGATPARRTRVRPGTRNRPNYGRGYDDLAAETLPVVAETSAGGLVLSGLAEAVDEHGNVDLDRIYVALIGRIDRRGRLLWSMPKGHVENNDSLRTTAEREVWEETGLTAKIIDTLGVIDYWFVSEGKRIHKTVHHHLLRYVDGDFNDEDPEVTEVGWFKASELGEKLTYADERYLAHRAAELLPGCARREKAAGRTTPR